MKDARVKFKVCSWNSLDKFGENGELESTETEGIQKLLRDMLRGTNGWDVPDSWYMKHLACTCKP